MCIIDRNQCKDQESCWHDPICLPKDPDINTQEYLTKVIDYWHNDHASCKSCPLFTEQPKNEWCEILHSSGNGSCPAID